MEPLLARIAQDETVPTLARELFAMQGRDYAQLQIELKAIEARLVAWHRAHSDSRRLAQIPGLGPIGATTLVMKTPDPRAFPSGRHFAAWLGLTPKDHSTGGKTRLGKITRARDQVLRSPLVAGATAVIQQFRRGRGHPSPWLVALLKRKPPKLAAVALANKIARIAWKLVATGESYDGARMPGASAFAAWEMGWSAGPPPRPSRSCKRRQMVGSIDPRCETVRGTHWPVKVAGVFGARVAETILASGQKRPHQQAGHMDASDPIKPEKTLVARGPSTYGSRRSPGRQAHVPL